MLPPSCALMAPRMHTQKPCPALRTLELPLPFASLQTNGRRYLWQLDVAVEELLAAGEIRCRALDTAQVVGLGVKLSAQSSGCAASNSHFDPASTSTASLHPSPLSTHHAPNPPLATELPAGAPPLEPAGRRQQRPKHRAPVPAAAGRRGRGRWQGGAGGAPGFGGRGGSHGGLDGGGSRPERR